MRAPTALMVAALLAVAACSDEGDTASPTTTTTTTVPPSTAPPTTAKACEPGGPQPQGGRVNGIGDVDGDGRADDAWIYRNDHGATVGVRTAAGRGSETTVKVGSVTELTGAADVNGDGRAELWISRTGGMASPTEVTLAAFVDCELRLVQNQEGEPYVVLVESDEGAEGGVDGHGIGCVDVDKDGKLDLVGLRYRRSGDNVDWTRTVIRVQDGKAVNGAVDRGRYTTPRDEAKVDLLSRITCGEKDLGATDGPYVN